MSAVKPNLWTATQFKNQTNPGDVRKAFADIDQKLIEWDGMKDGRSKEQRVLHLRTLTQACMAYLSIKESKQQKKNNARFGRPSVRLNNRITKVKTLMRQTFLRLAFEQYNYQKAVRARGLGVEEQLAALKGSYAHERTNFNDIKANQNLAGTQTHINPQGGSFVHQQHSKDHDEVPHNVRGILNKSFDTLSLNEFNTLQAHFSQGEQGLGHLPNVHFARKDERFRELMLVPIDGLLYKSSGELCTAKWNAYALDRYGNLLIEKANKTWQHGQKGAQINHSTLAAGREVICAGIISIEAGKITFLSNESGHYKPTKQQLANVLIILSEEYTLPILESLEEVVYMAGADEQISYRTNVEIVGFMAEHMHQ